MRVAVVGHVEWIRFARVERVPGPGEIAHSTDDWEQVGGGGGVAAIQLALLADEAHLFTALGDDELGRRSRERARGARRALACGCRPAPQRWAFTHIDEAGERTITTVGPEAPAARATTTGCRGPSSPRWTRCSSSPATSTHLRWARRAPVLTATARELETLRRGAVELDALIGSGEDEAERYHAGDLDPEPRARRDDLGRARRLDAAGRPVHGRAAPRAARGRLRLRRLVHGAGSRTRSAPGSSPTTRSPSPRGAVRRR